MLSARKLNSSCDGTTSTQRLDPKWFEPRRHGPTGNHSKWPLGRTASIRTYSTRGIPTVDASNHVSSQACTARRRSVKPPSNTRHCGGVILRHRDRISSNDPLHRGEQAFLADNCFILFRENPSTCGTHASKHTILKRWLGGKQSMQLLFKLKSVEISMTWKLHSVVQSSKSWIQRGVLIKWSLSIPAYAPASWQLVQRQRVAKSRSCRRCPHGRLCM